MFRGVRFAVRRKGFQKDVAVIPKATAADCEKALETQNNRSKRVEALAADSTLPQVPTTSPGPQRAALNSLPSMKFSFAVDCGNRLHAAM